MYKSSIQNANCVIRIEDGAIIPMSSDNRDFREFQHWLTIQGNILQQADDSAPEFPSVADELAAIRKAVLTGDKHDLQVIDTAAQASEIAVSVKGG